ncbi:High-affinity methionine permease [Sparassis crispa]|uniref:High-affinity methionine permease n=1 Tax=Sparassis crispa TaxID=139825 RepID=A0A401H343_9APHY|nr:High-affinity methionine permease [Sparassis crispa]GBE88809.1 High-affinity methionine permease [Sparassis crispa]
MSLLRFFLLSRREDQVATPSNVVEEERDNDEKLPTKDSDDVVSIKGPVHDDNSDLNPGELTFEEDAAGGMGRHLGVFSCTMLIIGRVIGTGIFSTPSSILNSVGSVGASLMLWVLGFVLSFCGLFIWLELGTMFPRSGGEKVYLEAAYPRPKYLSTVVFAANAILLGFTASGCIAFASNILISAGKEATQWSSRGIALGVIVFVTILHGLTPRLGVIVMNLLSIFKTFILLFIVVTGWVVLSGHTSIKDPHANFRNAFAGSSHSGYDYATAMFKVLFSYAGWLNVNYVMNNVRDPIRTLKIAGPLGLGICTIFYLLANVAYFAASTKEEIANSGVTVASLFFGKVFGTQAQRALTVFVALRVRRINRSHKIELIDRMFFDLSHIQKRRHGGTSLPPSIAIVYSHPCAKAFAAARINQELAKEGIPLPFGNRFWASNWPTGKTPLPGLIIHIIPTIIIILGPPPAVAYPFILDVEGYPGQIINFFVVIGLFWLRWHKPHAVRPFKVWLPLAVLFLAAAIFLLVAPFLRPPNGIGDTPPLPYYLYCIVGIGVMLFGVFYWAMWRVVPRWFGYKFVPRKDTLADGTVLTLFSSQKIE